MSHLPWQTTSLIYPNKQQVSFTLTDNMSHLPWQITSLIYPDIQQVPFTLTFTVMEKKFPFPWQATSPINHDKSQMTFTLLDNMCPSITIHTWSNTAHMEIVSNATTDKQHDTILYINIHIVFLYCIYWP